MSEVLGGADMKNREQVAWALGFSDYDDREAARTISDMLDAIGVYLDREDRARLERWFGLDCDPETNNWGVLPEDAEHG